MAPKRSSAKANQETPAKRFDDALRMSEANRKPDSRLTTPLRYSGGKSQVLDNFTPYIHPGIGEFREPFVGGGSFALWLQKTYGSTNPNLRIWINDKYPPVYCFWKVLQNIDATREMCRRILITHSGSQNLNHTVKGLEQNRHIITAPKFRAYLHAHNHISDEMIWVAAQYYVASRMAPEGIAHCGRYTPEKHERFVADPLMQLMQYPELISRWRITCWEADDVMRVPWTGAAPYAFLDPPYDIPHPDRYGNEGDLHRDFDHEKFQRLAEECAAMRSTAGADLKVMITYNKEMRARYKSGPWWITQYKNRKKIKILIMNWYPGDVLHTLRWKTTG